MQGALSPTAVEKSELTKSTGGLEIIQVLVVVRLRILASKEDFFFPKVRRWSDPVLSNCPFPSTDATTSAFARSTAGK